MLTKDQIDEVLTEEFLDWERNKYERRPVCFYKSSVEKAIAFEEYFYNLSDMDIIGIFWDANNEDELTNDEIRYIRATVVNGVDELLKENDKDIFAYPTKVFLGA
jgi:hypothetical protein